MAAFFSELKRRNVFKVAVAYGIVAWLVIQITGTVLPTFNAPQWINQVFTFFVLLGFPLALILAWAFELTPEGIKPTTAVSIEKSITRVTSRRIDFAIIALLGLALVYVVVDQYFLEEDTVVTSINESALPEVSAVTGQTEQSAPVPLVAAESERLPNSVAVLPFENLSPDPDDAYFAAGIHEEILNRLAKISDMSVISRTSMLNPDFTNGAMSIPEIAEDLNVEMIMEGSVRFANDQVRIAAQLIDARTDEHLWSEVYQRDLADVFKVQAEIATHIASALEAELTPEELSSIEKPLTDSPEAYGLYLKAMSVIGDIAPFNPLEQSMEFHQLLDRAIALDPEFATAHAFKAYDYAFSLTRPWPLDEGPGIEELVELARIHADTALALDPDLALAHAAYGLLYFLSKDIPRSEEAFERSLELDPNGFDALSEYAFQKSLAGNHAEAIELAKRGIVVNPHGWSAHALAGYRYRDAGDHDTAVQYYGQGVQLAPANIAARVWYGAELLHLGEVDTGMAELRIAEGMLQDFIAPAWAARVGLSIGLQGDSEGAQRILDRIVTMSEQYRVGDMTIAMAYLGVGEEELALEYLDKAANDPYVTEAFTLYTEVILNSYDDLVLEKPEFREVRKRLNSALED
jgi:TolB-like protein/Tfp pilus assembly protein PilF